MTTVRDVAKRASVSVATVSRVLSGYPHVSATTRERVLLAIEELDFRPDQVARSLRRRRTSLIGFIVSTIENVFFTEAAHAAEQVVRQRGYNLIVCNTDENIQQEQSYLEVLDRQLVAGIILAPAPGDAQHLRPYLSRECPMVLINRRLEHLACTSVTSNDEEAAYECVRRLIGENRKRIAAITGLPNVYTTQIRLQGFRRALASAGLGPESSLEVCGWANMEGGYEATLQLMERSDPPDAIFAFNNVMTRGAVVALQEMGVTWPDPVDIAGFGAFGTARLYRPPLTLIEQPAHEMGRVAAEHLLAQIEGDADRAPQQIILQNKLIPREAWLSERAIFSQ